jgi:putative membrane protein
MGPGGGFGMGWMRLWWLLVIVGVVAVIVGLVRAGGWGGSRGGHTTARQSSTRQILDKRFARGGRVSRSAAHRIAVRSRQ